MLSGVDSNRKKIKTSYLRELHDNMKGLKFLNQLMHVGIQNPKIINESHMELSRKATTFSNKSTPPPESYSFSITLNR